MRFENQARELVDFVQGRIAQKTSFQRRLVTFVLVGIAVCLLVLVFSWTMTLRFWRRQIERKNRAEDALRESEDKYRSLIDTSPDAIALADSSGRFLTVNPAMAERFSSGSRDLPGKTYYEIMEQESAERCVGYGEQAIQEKRIIYSEDERQDRNYEDYYIPVYTSYGESLFQVISKDVTEKKEMEKRLLEMSLYDANTNLYSRYFFQEELNRLADDRHRPLGLIVADINGLKFVNDTLGHQKGDQLLSTAADILKRSFRDSDIVARIGGDEFAVLLPQSEEEILQRCCSRIREELRQHNQQYPELGLSLSLGYAVENRAPPDTDALFKQADDAMYKDKMLHRQSSGDEMFQTLEKTLESRDHLNAGHAESMSKHALQLGRSVDLSRDRLNNLDLLVRFHDLGKIRVPDHILFKPGPLTQEQWNQMREHCVVGQRIASYVSDLESIADLILKHHEHWDGSGYPLGLAGEEIPIECRIFAIVEAYDAMTSERPYKEAVPREEAILELRHCSGAQFDPDLVERFIRICTG